MHRWSSLRGENSILIPLFCIVGGPFLVVACHRRECTALIPVATTQRIVAIFDLLKMIIATCVIHHCYSNVQLESGVLFQPHRESGMRLTVAVCQVSATRCLLAELSYNIVVAIVHLWTTFDVLSSSFSPVFLQPCGDFGCCGNLCGCTRTLF